jgi:hypothetical protein
MTYHAELYRSPLRPAIRGGPSAGDNTHAYQVLEKSTA